MEYLRSNRARASNFGSVRTISFFIPFLQLVILLSSLPAPALAVDAEIYAGKTLESALQDLQRHGLNILYSSDLVHPEMKVLSEPIQGSPRQMLDQLLAAHGLRTERGPRDTLLVVRAKEAANAQPGRMVSDTIASTREMPSFRK